MKKLIVLTLTLGAFLAVSPTLAMARERRLPERLLEAWEKPRCGRERAEATVGNPVTLEGTGRACARGRGILNYEIERGRVWVRGKGVVAVRGTDAKVRGFGGHLTVGDWTFYWGTGKLLAKGDDFVVRAWLNGSRESRDAGRTRVIGQGKATYRGEWKVRYGGLALTDQDETDTVELPESAKSAVDVETLQVAE